MTRLIVNADDFGFFHCVSDGILECVDRGTVTAASVMATGPALVPLAGAATAREHLDLGVHLDLSYGTPLSASWKRRCEASAGRFPGRNAILRGLASRRLSAKQVEPEWRAQIEHCQGLGLNLRFLNSHEHLHMFPPLHSLARMLASDYGIHFVRRTAPDWPTGTKPAAAVTNAFFALLGYIHGDAAAREREPRFLGLTPSGRLDLAYIEATLPRLERGGTYELMCHPGRFDAREIRDPALIAYHDWDDEHALLVGDAFRETCERAGVELVGYRDL